MLAKTTRRKTLDQLFEQLAKGETQELRLILKGDSAGSVEAIERQVREIVSYLQEDSGYIFCAIHN